MGIIFSKDQPYYEVSGSIFTPRMYTQVYVRFVLKCIVLKVSDNESGMAEHSCVRKYA